MITVTPTIYANITVTAELAVNQISVTPSVFSEIEVEPVLSDNVIAVDPEISGSTISAEADLYTTVQVYSGEVEYYTGSYEWIPTTDTQTIDISGLMATADITINPIPSNYGLITWDGATLTVS